MNILMLRHSAGFEHSYLPDAEVALKQIGAANGWNVTTTHRCDRITAENLEKQDILAFATTGNLPFDDAQKEALLSFVRNGKAFFGIHNATDTCYDWPEYGEMLGGYFAGHPWHEEVNVIVEDTDHPATRMLGSSFKVVDEIYTFKEWDRSKTRVLMRLDNDSIDVSPRAIARTTITPSAGAILMDRDASCTPHSVTLMHFGAKNGSMNTSQAASNGQADWKISHLDRLAGGV